MRIFRQLVGAASVLIWALAAPAASAQSGEKLRVGFIATFTGPSGILGQHLYDGFMLGVDHASGRLGGIATDVIKMDDQLRPEISVKVANDLIERDKVHFISGVVFSNVMLAIHRPIVDSGTFFIGANSGPAPMAGERCNPYFFSASYQDGMMDESMGRYLNQQGVKKVYALTPNYIAGRDAIEHFKRAFKGEVVNEVYTRMDQLDYSAEIAQLKSSGVDSAYIFYPGGFGINFLRQFNQAGLHGMVKIYSKYTTDWTTIGAQGDAAIGNLQFAAWNSDLDNPANKRFVADYVKKYGYTPSGYSEQAYDAAQLIDSAVRAVKGNLSDKEGIRKALRAADIQSPRGPFKFNRNHFPIQDQHLIEAVKGADGKPTLVTRDFVFHEVKDSHVDQCPMTW